MRKVVLLGIGGTGMSALAGLFVQQGWVVEGMDGPLYPPVDGILRKLGIPVREGYEGEHLPAADLYVVGNAISRGNPQLEWLLAQDLPFVSMATALRRYFLEGRPRVVVSGTHGKTTTTSWLAHLLDGAGYAPGYFIGGQPLSLPGSSHPGGAKSPFILEGDEYESCFHERFSKFYLYNPHHLILGACEFDHADFFESPSAYRRAFVNLVDQIPATGTLVIHTGIERWEELAGRCRGRVESFGLHAGQGGWRLMDVKARSRGQEITWRAPDGRRGILLLPLWGVHNALNILAGLALSDVLGVEASVWERASGTFTGVRRRLQCLGQRGDLLWVEDFAHHPTAVRSAVAAAREHRPHAGVHVIFEPGSATLRMDALSGALTEALAQADRIWLYAPDTVSGRIRRLDPDRLVAELRGRGRDADLFRDSESLWEAARELSGAQPETVLLLSNGRLGGLAGRVESAFGMMDG